MTDDALLFKNLQVGDKFVIGCGDKPIVVEAITSCSYKGKEDEAVVCREWCPGKVKLTGDKIPFCYGRTDYPYTFIYKIVPSSRPADLLDDLIKEL